ncbi:ABC transporter ATP-binding protein [Arachidicoccus terrestris]|uniref:ABC transporter ATP-binding protein n=1 Tax=Arachidicoccus terrestris TaxID=2875539 RepID=UPI001CC5F27D|nr:ABC transporter ATP-binding protein [Arachidicoccus terrestris]UAY54565.1 ABC transporter ATP-binding protein/permease [Arachidicoccus terrestris]
MLNLKYSNSILGYFKFYYSIINNKIYNYILINIIIGLFDGIGLSLFIPLLLFNNSDSTVNAANSKFLNAFVSIMHSTHIEITTLSILLLILTVFAIKGLFRFLQMFYLAKMKQTFVTSIQKNLVNGLSNLSYAGFTKLDAGRIQNNFVNEVNKLYITMTYYFNCVQYGTMLLTYIALSLMTDFRISLSLIILSSITLFLYKSYFKKTKETSIDLSIHGDVFNSHLTQAINHFKYLKATSYLSRYSQKLIQIIQKTELLNLKMGKQYAITEGVKEPIAILIICLIIFFQTKMLGQSLEGIMICLLLLYRCLIQFTLLQSSWLSFLQNIGSMNSVSKINSEIKLNQEHYPLTKLQLPIEKIELVNTSVMLSGRTIIANINLTIKQNSIIAFVGQSGAGKTTLANLIMGLFPPDEGKVLVNDKDLHQLNIDSYRNNFGYISQDTVIFNTSIFNNVTFFDLPNEANKKRFWKAIKTVFLYEFIQELKEKENTILGDNGILISGGQKQRISIAREIYKDSPILVLDEATSSLDSTTENIIKESIEKLKGQKTIIVIAHRIATIKDVDTIYLINNKKIQNSGSFESLFSDSEIFRVMAQSQLF